jgi:hypothetical protein
MTLVDMAVNSGLLDDVFDDIVTGAGVLRSKHELSLDKTEVTGRFLKALNRNGYLPAGVGDVDVQPGERVPAFHIREKTAYFGWVFWEKFSEKKSRKLWGSVVRNSKGDWLIQLLPGKAAVIYANPSHKMDMDIDNPR